MTNTTTETKPLTVKQKAALVTRYATAIRPLLPLATKAYGAKDTISPEHTASRRYTELLVNFHNAGGSIYSLAKELGVTYPGLNRRLTTATLASTHKATRPKFDASVYEAAAKRVRKAQAKSPRAFHAQLYVEYVENELSLDKLGREYLSLSGAASLYFGVNREKLRRAGEID